MASQGTFSASSVERNRALEEARERTRFQYKHVEGIYFELQPCNLLRSSYWLQEEDAQGRLKYIVKIALYLFILEPNVK